MREANVVVGRDKTLEPLEGEVEPLTEAEQTKANLLKSRRRRPENV